MLIQPREPIPITLKSEETNIDGYLMSISDEEIILSSKDYLTTKSTLFFTAKFFNGQAGIKSVNFDQEKGKFSYILEIYTIHFQPGFLINCRT